MYPYRTGDVVRVYNYPFIPKSMQQDNTDNERQGKERYGVVINSGGRYATTVPILQISTHSGKTEKDGYMLRDDEIRVPQGITYKKRYGDKELFGVIKTERIEQFEQDEISAPLTKIPLRTKLDIISQYEYISSKTYFKEILDNESPNHAQAMGIFKDAVLAEKLNFLVTDDGKRKYETMKFSDLELSEIQPLARIGKGNAIGVYSLKLKGDIDTFTYTIGTLKSDEQIAKDWSKPKKAHEWISEDIKYNILKKDIDKNLRPDPLINTNNYIDFKDFKKEVLDNNENNRKKGFHL